MRAFVQVCVHICVCVCVFTGTHRAKGKVLHPEDGIRGTYEPLSNGTWK